MRKKKKAEKDRQEKIYGQRERLRRIQARRKNEFQNRNSSRPTGQSSERPPFSPHAPKNAPSIWAVTAVR